ncbi:MAG: NAD(P)/FAD-dependent oxidoreductase [Chloroflexi bacterium]|nr:NAD(P)/FAD-dependent oxidoreductase [Chloroflexota bacterium]
MSERVVILGGGVAAGYAAKKFMEQKLDSNNLTIVSADDRPPYDRPPLSKSVLAGEKSLDDIYINPANFYETNGIHLVLNTRIKEVNLRSRMLVSARNEMIGYDKLIICTGARVRKLNIPGSELEGIYYLRSASDAARLLEAKATAENVVVVGGGYIGMETAASLCADGRTITMVFPNEYLLPAVLAPSMADFFEAYYEYKGVTILKGVSATGFAGEKGQITGVEVDSGEILPADMVVVGIGVEPNVELFSNSGLHIQDGIIVNKYLETNRAGIYAAGDVANYYDIFFDKRRRIEHWQNAIDQGRHVVADIMSNKRKRRDHFASIPYFFSDIFDLSYALCEIKKQRQHPIEKTEHQC